MAVTRIMVVLLLLLLAPVAMAERYFTWVDEQGRVQHSPIPGSAEKARESESAESGTEAGEASASALQEDSPYTLENFPDGNEALRDLQGKQPYFTWVDAEGRIHNTPYDPTREPARSRQAEQPAPQRVYSRALDVSLATEQEVANRADPAALELLGIASTPSILGSFAEACCMDLAPASDELRAGRGFEVRLTADSPVHDFSTGYSHYRLYRLPQGTKAERLRVRSFIRDGAFIPTLVFLNQALEPQRVVTDIVFGFEPETWSRHGYLEARLPVKPGAEEYYVLLLTREKDERSQTLIESGVGGQSAVQIEHRPHGLLELRLDPR